MPAAGGIPAFHRLWSCATIFIIKLDILLNLPMIRIAMADKGEKYSDNASGKFYVDEQCIDCDLCRETAPDFFTRNDDDGYSFVYKQPESEEDIALCMEALEGCPVDAIGEDGEDEAVPETSGGSPAEAVS